MRREKKHRDRLSSRYEKLLRLRWESRIRSSDGICGLLGMDHQVDATVFNVPEELDAYAYYAPYFSWPRILRRNW